MKLFLTLFTVSTLLITSANAADSTPQNTQEEATACVATFVALESDLSARLNLAQRELSTVAEKLESPELTALVSANRTVRELLAKDDLPAATSFFNSEYKAALDSFSKAAASINEGERLAAMGLDLIAFYNRYSGKLPGTVLILRDKKLVSIYAYVNLHEPTKVLIDTVYTPRELALNRTEMHCQDYVSDYIRSQKK
jgi:hypothetical protein